MQGRDADEVNFQRIGGKLRLAKGLVAGQALFSTAVECRLLCTAEGECEV